MTLHFSTITDMMLDKDVRQYEAKWNNIGMGLENILVESLGLDKANEWEETDWRIENYLLCICGDFVFITQDAGTLLRLVDDTDLLQDRDFEPYDDIFIYEFESKNDVTKYLDDYLEYPIGE